jgi:hypothetical protein
VEFDEAGLPLGVDEPEGVNPEPFHHGKTARQGAITHHPHEHVGAFRRQRDEIPEGIVSGGRLRNFIVWLRLHGVDQVGEFDSILDEEHRHVVADQVPHSFVGVELDREAADVSSAVGRPAGARDSRETDEDGRLSRRIGQQSGLRQVGQVLVDLKYPVRCGAACVHDALGDVLMIEVGDFFAEMKILHKRRAAASGLERILVVGNLDALVPRHDFAGLDGVVGQVGSLVRFPVEGFLITDLG